MTGIAAGRPNMSVAVSTFETAAARGRSALSALLLTLILRVGRVRAIRGLLQKVLLVACLQMLVRQSRCGEDNAVASHVRCAHSHQEIGFRPASLR
jgi:hypothetical protein